MAEYEEDQIEFSVLGIVQDPLVDYIGQLAQNVKTHQKINAYLPESVSNDGLKDVVLGPEPSLHLTQADIESAIIPTAEEEYKPASLEKLLSHRQRLASRQQSIKQSIHEELQSHQAEDDYAAGRRHDYSPAVRAWVQKLARKKMIQELVERSH